MPDPFSRLLQALPLPAGYQLTEQGCYRYRLNGQLQAITEPWIKAQNSEGQCLTQSARFIEHLQAALLVTQRQQSPQFCAQNPSVPGNFYSEIRWQQQGHNDISALYQFCQQTRQLQLLRTDDTGLSNSQLHKPEAFLYFPLLRVFSGQVIQQLALSGPLSTLVPDINKPADRTTLLQPTETVRSSTLIAEEVIEMGGQPYRAQRYRYLSERYQAQDDASFWIDNKGLLLKYHWQQNPQQFWQVELETDPSHIPTLNPQDFLC
ncbi:hypothetical protein [Rheinheimera sp.]|uniref:hypothetical protein n=1 Tax=Rheinheimera sp. TaxID=1869214 RepID=UPI00307F1393